MMKSINHRGDDNALRGKVILVTGSSRGIGEGIAVEFARAGCCVMTNTNEDIRQAQRVGDRCREFGVESVAIGADISRLSDIRKLFNEVKKRFKRLDILVNNAAVFYPGEALTYREQDWNHLYETNIRGTFFCSQAAARLMRENGGGSIVNISSLGGAMGWPGLVAYCATKGAIESMTRALACEWAPLNIRVNAVAPGHIATPPNLESLKDPRRKKWTQSRVLLGRLGTLEEIAKVVTFVSSPAASYITGQILYVEGGIMSWQGFR